MSVSHQTQPNSTKFKLKKGTYFRSDISLYYIVDIQPNEDNPFLIEDCFTNIVRWWNVSEMIEAKKEVITPSE